MPAVVLHLLQAPERTRGGSHGLMSKAGRALPPSASLLNTWKAGGLQRLAFTLHYIKIQFNSRLKETKETQQHHVTPDAGLDVFVISNICWDNLHNMNGACRLAWSKMLGRESEEDANFLISVVRLWRTRRVSLFVLKTQCLGAMGQPGSFLSDHSEEKNILCILLATFL